MNALTKLILLLLPWLPTYSFASVNVNGFGSIYSTSSLTEARYLSADSDIEFSKKGKIGINLNAPISDDVTSHVQLIANGSSQIDNKYAPLNRIRAEWALIDFQLSDSVKAIMGRQLTPIWNNSEFISVGLTYNMLALPEHIYTLLPINFFDGYAIEYANTFPQMQFSFRIFGGSTNGDFMGGSQFYKITADDLIGLTTNIQYNDLKLRLSYLQSKISAKIYYGYWAGSSVSQIGEVTDEGDVDIFKAYSAGLYYDNGKIYFESEYGKGIGENGTPMDLSVKSGGQSTENGPLLAGQEGYYVALGYRFGKWLPVLVGSHSKRDLGFLSGYMDEKTLSLRYDYRENIALKAAFSTAKSTRSTSLLTTKDQDAEAIYFGADFIF